MDIAINRINAGSYIPLELNGTTLHVGSLPVDLDAERKDVTVVIDLYLSEKVLPGKKQTGLLQTSLCHQSNTQIRFMAMTVKTITLKSYQQSASHWHLIRCL